MGELKHGIYNDKCEDLTEEEINAFFGFDANRELIDVNEDSDSEDSQISVEEYEVHQTATTMTQSENASNQNLPDDNTGTKKM